MANTRSLTKTWQQGSIPWLGVMLYQARKHIVCAGFVVSDKHMIVTKAAPIIRHLILGQELSRAKVLLEDNGYVVERVESNQRPSNS